MVNSVANGKNIWVAASDGDLERVQELVAAGTSPNAFDANSYSPMHAAASYAHEAVLAFLVAAGGDVNLADADGDTPLYVVETLPAAQWLLAHGADPAHRNADGRSPAHALHEDCPEVAAYLRSVTGEPAPPPTPEEGAQHADADADADAGAGAGATADGQHMPDGVSNQAVDAYAAQQTNDLLARAKEIMEQAERDGSNPDERIREVVEQAVRDGFQFGAANNDGDEHGAADGGKRARAD